MTFQAKGMWEATRVLEREAYAAGRAARCAELTALRHLEKAVRSAGLPAVMCSGESFMQPIVAALTEVDKAKGHGNAA